MSRNRQLFPTGTVRPCTFCAAVFTVEANPNRTGEFCSITCGRKFSRSKVRTPAQRKADQAADEQARIATEKAAAEARIANCLAEAAAREKKRCKEEWIARERAWKEQVEWVQASELHNLEIRLEREARARGPAGEPCPTGIWTTKK